MQRLVMGDENAALDLKALQAKPPGRGFNIATPVPHFLQGIPNENERPAVELTCLATATPAGARGLRRRLPRPA